jgi:hypothetical protein
MKEALELLNDVKVDLSEYLDEELNHIEKQQMKNNVKKIISKDKHYNRGNKHYNIKKIAAVSLASISLVGILNAGAITKPIEKLFSKNPVQNFANYNNTKAIQYTTVVEKQVTNKGITIALNEVIFDYKNILVTYTISGANNENGSLSATPKVFINGKEVRRKSFSGSYSDKDKNLKIFIFEPREQITEAGMFDVKVVFGGIDDFKQDKIIEEGNWEFNFKASNNAIVGATKEFNIKKDIKLSSGTIICIDKVIVTPISTTVEFTTKNIAKVDFNGNFHPNFVVKDSKGNDLKPIGSHYHQTESSGEGTVRFRNVDKSATSINITPGIFENVYTNTLYNNELKENSFKIDIK